ncbi:dipeptidyl aminopeptidase A [Diutina catenulata]
MKYDEPRRSSRPLWTGSVLLLLVWGSYLLVGHINTLLATARVGVPVPSPAHSHKDDPRRLNVTGWHTGVFRPEFQSVQWLRSDDALLHDQGQYVVREDGFYVHQVADNSSRVLFPGNAFDHGGKTHEIDDLVASPNLEWALLTTQKKKQWRHSSHADYWVWHAERKQLSHMASEVSVAVWAPDSRQVAYVRNNDIWVYSVDTGDRQRVTHDGSAQVFNGKPDWVYEEEVWASDVAMWWSPDSASLAFLRSDDSHVPTYPLEFFAKKSSGANGTSGIDSYPTVEYLKYPKAGATNPTVDVVVYDVAKQKTRTHHYPESAIKQKNRVVIDVAWIGSQLLTKLVNRNSTVAEYHVDHGLARREATDGWFQLVSTARYVPRNESQGRHHDGFVDYVFSGGWKHLAYFGGDHEPQLLTKGNWEVTKVLGFDWQAGVVYFESTRHESVGRTISRVSLSKPFKVDDVARDGYFSGSLSHGGRYLFQTYSGPGLPSQKIVDLHSHQVVAHPEANHDLKKRLEKVDLPTVNVKPLQIDDDESGKSLKVWVREYLPPKFDPQGQYPLILAPYGGPYSQSVSRKFSVDFSSVLASQLNAVVVVVDGRGTGFNNLNNFGSNFTYVVKGQLGHYEPMDQIAAARAYSAEKYIDSDKVAIWGWSFGGFLTLKTLETDVHQVVKYGVAVAPVTSWKFYDSVYTEQFMGTPEENPDGYATASVNNVTNFKNARRFMVAHGTGDDNVHIQNTYALLDQFNLEEVDNYDLLVYPDSDHSISFDNANRVIYRRILEWFRQAFAEPSRI